jgi:hypothetical protein
LLQAADELKTARIPSPLAPRATSVKRNCLSCDDWEPCALDLKRDPNTSIWEAYCPNSDVLNALVALTEVIR